jgi:hypothetical protein
MVRFLAWFLILWLVGCTVSDTAVLRPGLREEPETSAE